MVLIGILTSKKDPAGKNIREYLANNYFSEKIGEFEGAAVFKSHDFLLIETDRSLLDANQVENKFNPDLWIFGSKHASEVGINSLTVHSPGNFDKAMYGGRDKELAYSDANVIKNCFLELNELNNRKKSKYAVSLEVTHHGPTELKKPVVFVEIGSNIEAWNDKTAVKMASEAIMSCNERKNKWKIATGFGGTHYAPSFNRVLLKTEYATGHIYPKYAIFDEKMVKDAINRTINCKFIILDWKGLNKSQKEIIYLANKELNLPVLRTDELLQ